MMDKIASVLAVLRDDELLEEMSKGAGVLSGIGNFLRAGDKGGQAAANFLRSKGHENLAMAARFAPHATGAVVAKKAYDSEPAQKLKRKYQEHKIRKAMRIAQQGYQ
jgi:hypothetical protein